VDSVNTTIVKCTLRMLENISFLKNTNNYERKGSERELDFFAYAHEVCLTTKRAHLQCYAYARAPMMLTQWTKVLKTPGNKHANVLPMIASFDENESYRSKEGQLIKMGAEPWQGSRTDLLDVKLLLDEGIQPMQTANERPAHFATVMRYERSFEQYFGYKRRGKMQNDRAMPEVIIRWGPPGTGETRWLDNTFGLYGWTGDNGV